jgi:hypothetical protein
VLRLVLNQLAQEFCCVCVRGGIAGRIAMRSIELCRSAVGSWCVQSCRGLWLPGGAEWAQGAAESCVCG